MSRKPMYYFNGTKTNQDEWLTRKEYKRHLSLSKLLKFLKKKNEKSKTL